MVVNFFRPHKKVKSEDLFLHERKDGKHRQRNAVRENLFSVGNHLLAGKSPLINWAKPSIALI
jgi:hypothetical protein